MNGLSPALPRWFGVRLTSFRHSSTRVHWASRERPATCRRGDAATVGRLRPRARTNAELRASHGRAEGRPRQARLRRLGVVFRDVDTWRGDALSATLAALRDLGPCRYEGQPARAAASGAVPTAAQSWRRWRRRAKRKEGSHTARGARRPGRARAPPGRAGRGTPGAGPGAAQPSVPGTRECGAIGLSDLCAAHSGPDREEERARKPRIGGQRGHVRRGARGVRARSAPAELASGNLADTD